jgi:predicted RNase H-like HicB family nuclease
MAFEDYTIVLYRQDDGSWVAEIPSVPRCYALMPARQGVLAELRLVFDMIAEECREKDFAPPADASKIIR